MSGSAAEDWPEDEVRAALAGLPTTSCARVLETRELEALRFGYRERVTDMDLAHIRDLPQVLPELFAEAARRAREAGFDGVELHYAHAYTMASFLSRLNIARDGYGGSREHRVRLPLEVFRRVRATRRHGLRGRLPLPRRRVRRRRQPVDDAACFGVEFARAGMDFLSLSRGGKFEDAKQPKVGGAAYPYTGPSGYECMPPYVSDERGPFGRNVEPAAAIRAAVRAAGFATPVVVTGGIHGFEQAEALLARRGGRHHRARAPEPRRSRLVP